MVNRAAEIAAWIVAASLVTFAVLLLAVTS